MEVLEIAAGLPSNSPATTPMRILWAGDSPQAFAAVQVLVGRDGVEVTRSEPPQIAGAALYGSVWDMAVLHLDLTDAGDLALCGEFAASGRPVLVVPLASSLAGRIAVLERGVAGLSPPTPHPLELAAQVQAMMRRHRRRTVDTAARSRWRFDQELGCVEAVSGRMVRLGGAENALLRAFTARPGRILSRDDLAGMVRRQGGQADSRLIHARVSRLRLALTPCDGAHDLIRTLRGGGYLLHATVRAA